MIKRFMEWNISHRSQEFCELIYSSSCPCRWRVLTKTWWATSKVTPFFDLGNYVRQQPEKSHGLRWIIEDEKGNLGGLKREAKPILFLIRHCFDAIYSAQKYECISSQTHSVGLSCSNGYCSRDSNNWKPLQTLLLHNRPLIWQPRCLVFHRSP